MTDNTLPSGMGNPIEFDFKTGAIRGANLIEYLGLKLMRIGAILTAPKQFFGYSYISKLVKLIFPSGRTVNMKIDDDFVFAFPYGDPYWGTLLDNSQLYEPDIQQFMQVIADVDYAFIDCGANFGYMSAYASSAAAGSRPAIAIEIDQGNMESLTYNNAINGDRFEVRHNAVYSVSGNEVPVFGAKHEAFSMVDDGDGKRGTVTTLAISDLTSWLKEKECANVIVKLDVEGAEKPAIDGIGDLGGAEILLIYEEHGSETDHDVSRYLKDGNGYRLFYYEKGSATEITSLDMLDAIKQNPRYGYDLFATKSRFWLEKISGL